MPALKPTDFFGEIVWIGAVQDRKANLASTGLERADVGFEGIAGEAHGGLTRASCNRVIRQHPFGTQIRNTRQLSIVSEEELALIARNMGLQTLRPDQVGASMMIRGLPDLTHLPPSSRLQATDGTTFIVDMENRPCMLPAPVIEAEEPGKGGAFISAAKGLRGIVASVERSGQIHVGDAIRLHVPDQRLWAHHEAL